MNKHKFKVGNYVASAGQMKGSRNLAKIAAIENDNITCELVTENCTRLNLRLNFDLLWLKGFNHWLSVNPIPIDENTISEFGFFEREKGIFRKKNEYTYFEYNGIWVLHFKRTCTQVEYIHEIQNQFALKGKEFERVDVSSIPYVQAKGFGNFESFEEKCKRLERRENHFKEMSKGAKKYAIELLICENNTYLNFWDSLQGNDVIVEVVEGKLIQEVETEKSIALGDSIPFEEKEFENKEISIVDFIRQISQR